MDNENLYPLPQPNALHRSSGMPVSRNHLKYPSV